MKKLRVWLKNENRFSYHDLTIAEDVGGLALILEEEMPHEMQFSTSLKGKNGKEIYEGDWLKFIEENIAGVVTYQDNAFVIGGWGIGSAAKFPEKYEIIGNIYEHPHLLNNKDV